MLQTFCQESLIRAHGVVAIYPAYSDGDDIKVLTEDRSEVTTVLHGLRQQVSYMYIRIYYIMQL